MYTKIIIVYFVGWFFSLRYFYTSPCDARLLMLGRVSEPDVESESSWLMKHRELGALAPTNQRTKSLNKLLTK